MREACMFHQKRESHNQFVKGKDKIRVVQQYFNSLCPAPFPVMYTNLRDLADGELRYLLDNPSSTAMYDGNPMYDGHIMKTTARKTIEGGDPLTGRTAKPKLDVIDLSEEQPTADSNSRAEKQYQPHQHQHKQPTKLQQRQHPENGAGDNPVQIITEIQPSVTMTQASPTISAPIVSEQIQSSVPKKVKAPAISQPSSSTVEANDATNSLKVVPTIAKRGRTKSEINTSVADSDMQEQSLKVELHKRSTNVQRMPSAKMSSTTHRKELVQTKLESSPPSNHTDGSAPTTPLSSPTKPLTQPMTSVKRQMVQTTLSPVKASPAQGSTDRRSSPTKQSSPTKSGTLNSKPLIQTKLSANPTAVLIQGRVLKPTAVASDNKKTDLLLQRSLLKSNPVDTGLPLLRRQEPVPVTKTRASLSAVKLNKNTLPAPPVPTAPLAPAKTTLPAIAKQPLKATSLKSSALKLNKNKPAAQPAPAAKPISPPIAKQTLKLPSLKSSASIREQQSPRPQHKSQDKPSIAEPTAQPVAKQPPKPTAQKSKAPSKESQRPQRPQLKQHSQDKILETTPQRAAEESHRLRLWNAPSISDKRQRTDAPLPSLPSDANKGPVLKLVSTVKPSSSSNPPSVTVSVTKAPLPHLPPADLTSLPASRDRQQPEQMTNTTVPSVASPKTKAKATKPPQKRGRGRPKGSKNRQPNAAATKTAPPSSVRPSAIDYDEDNDEDESDDDGPFTSVLGRRNTLQPLPRSRLQARSRGSTKLSGPRTAPQRAQKTSSGPPFSSIAQVNERSSGDLSMFAQMRAASTAIEKSRQNELRLQDVAASTPVRLKHRQAESAVNERLAPPQRAPSSNEPLRQTDNRKIPEPQKPKQSENGRSLDGEGKCDGSFIVRRNPTDTHKTPQEKIAEPAKPLSKRDQIQKEAEEIAFAARAAQRTLNTIRLGQAKPKSQLKPSPHPHSQQQQAQPQQAQPQQAHQPEPQNAQPQLPKSQPPKVQPPPPKAPPPPRQDPQSQPPKPQPKPRQEPQPQPDPRPANEPLAVKEEARGEVASSGSYEARLNRSLLKILKEPCNQLALDVRQMMSNDVMLLSETIIDTVDEWSKERGVRNGRDEANMTSVTPDDMARIVESVLSNLETKRRSR